MIDRSADETQARRVVDRRAQSQGLERHQALVVVAGDHAVVAGFAGGLIAGFLPDLFSRILSVSMAEPAPFRYSLFLSGALVFVGFLLSLMMREGQGEQVQGKRSKAAGPFPSCHHQ